MPELKHFNRTTSDSFDVFGRRPASQSRVGDRDRVRRDLVGEISIGRWLLEWLEIQRHRFVFEHERKHSNEHISLQVAAPCYVSAQLNSQPVENMSMLFLFSLPVVVVVLLVGWLLLVDRCGLEDSGGNPSPIKRQERHEQNWPRY